MIQTTTSNYVWRLISKEFTLNNEVHKYDDWNINFKNLETLKSNNLWRRELVYRDIKGSSDIYVRNDHVERENSDCNLDVRENERSVRSQQSSSSEYQENDPRHPPVASRSPSDPVAKSRSLYATTNKSSIRISSNRNPRSQWIVFTTKVVTSIQNINNRWRKRSRKEDESNRWQKKTYMMSCEFRWLRQDINFRQDPYWNSYHDDLIVSIDFVSFQQSGWYRAQNHFSLRLPRAEYRSPHHVKDCNHDRWLRKSESTTSESSFGATQWFTILRVCQNSNHWEHERASVFKSNKEDQSSTRRNRTLHDMSDFVSRR